MDDYRTFYIPDQDLIDWWQSDQINLAALTNYGILHM